MMLCEDGVMCILWRRQEEVLDDAKSCELKGVKHQFQGAPHSPNGADT